MFSLISSSSSNHPIEKKVAEVASAKSALTVADVLKGGRNVAKRTSSKTSSKKAKAKPFRDGIVFNNTGRPPLVRAPTNNSEFRVVQSYELNALLTASNAVTTFGAVNFMVSSLDQIASLTNVFDQYRIERIEAWLIPRITNVQTSPLLNTGLFHSVIDFDDSTVLTTVGQALDYANCVVSSGTDGHYRTWVPHVAMAAYSGVFTSFANVESPWIDAVSTGVQHYGLKTAWTQCDAAYIMDAVVRLHTVWRNVR
jgi:hypothetical protein